MNTFFFLMFNDVAQTDGNELWTSKNSKLCKYNPQSNTQRKLQMLHVQYTPQ